MQIFDSTGLRLKRVAAGSFVAVVVIFFSPILPVSTLHAESTQQVITLRPGWNAVWLGVSPENNAVESVFAGIPVRSVWRHYSEEAAALYIDDATTLKPESERWLTWVPSANTPLVIQSLQQIHGGRCYLVDLDSAVNVTWSVIGRPLLRNLSWINASYTLTGLRVDPGTPPTFAQFFSGSPAHQSIDVRRLNAAGQWITIPTSTAIDRNEAYWIQCRGISSFQGSGFVEIDNQGLLDYGATTVEHIVTLRNDSAASASFSLSLLDAVLPSGITGAGPLALSLWRDGSSGTYGWEPLVGTKTVTVLANTKKVVRLAIRRIDMSSQGTGGPFRSILRVVGLQTASDIGLRADGIAASGSGLGVGSRYAGLWSGPCVLRSVNEPAGTSPNTLQPTASEASLRLLVRVAADGSVSLLREAYIFWLDGLTDLDGNVTEPGRFLVAGSDAEIAQLQATYGLLGAGRLKGAAVRDGTNVPRRLSSVGFSFTAPRTMTGAFSPASGALAGTVTIGFNDDLNPYKHRYHPDHDNLKDGSAAAGVPVLLPPGQESYDITRQITLQFQNTDPEDLRFSGWGDTVVGGSYSETITGLHRHPVKVGGTFRLTRVVAQ